uniref:Uncharacterized protein n=1 Tax=Triticum urartu TaxID=4572 RepID=A0A8R7UUZ8_TRIUA
MPSSTSAPPDLAAQFAASGAPSASLTSPAVPISRDRCCPCDRLRRRRPPSLPEQP